MSDKLQELTERLYNEGVDKARKEAESIIADAESRRDSIIKEAKTEAENIVDKGRKEANDIKSRTENELGMAARQAESALKQRFIAILADKILTDEVGRTLGDEGLLKDLILTTVSAWADSGEVPDITLVLAGSNEGAFSQALEKELADRLKRSPVIEFSKRMKSGFRIESKDDTYTLSFTEKDFEEFFRSFLREKTRTILFGED